MQLKEKGWRGRRRKKKKKQKEGKKKIQKKVLVKTMANTLQIGAFLLFESSCFKEFRSQQYWPEIAKNVLIYIYIKINGTFYYQEPPESLY